MKKIYIVIPIVIVIIIGSIVIANSKERENLNQENTNKFNNILELTDNIFTNYKGETVQITEQNDINEIKDILLNSKFDDWSTDSIIYFRITLNGEEYYFENRGKTVTKGGDKEEYLSDEASNKILNILNKYINKHFEKEDSNKTLNILDNIYSYN